MVNSPHVPAIEQLQLTMSVPCQIAHRMTPENPAYSHELDTIETFFAVREHQKQLSWLNSSQIPATPLPQPAVPMQQSPVAQATPQVAIYPAISIWGNPNVQFVYKKKES